MAGKTLLEDVFSGIERLGYPPIQFSKEPTVTQGAFVTRYIP